MPTKSPLVRSLLLLLATACSGWAGSAIRSVSPDTGVVEIVLTPSTGIIAYAYEEIVPPDVVPRAISDEGVFDIHTQTIKWGPFTNDHSRVVSYRLVSGSIDNTTVTGQLTEAQSSTELSASATTGPTEVTVRQTGLEAIVLRNYGPAALDRPLGAPLEDVDADGRLNVIEYLLQLDPEVNDRPTYKPVFDTASGQFGLRLRQRIDLPEVTISTQYSTNLIDWTASAATVSTLIDHGDGTETRFIGLAPNPASTPASMAMRLEYQIEP